MKKYRVNDNTEALPTIIVDENGYTSLSRSGPATATALTGTASTSTVAGPFTPDLGRPINLTLSGTFAGTVTLKRSTDAGTTKLPLTISGQSTASFTGACNEPVWEESEAGATFYLDIALTSGSVTYRLAQ